MAELRFVTGTVACGKTLELVLTAHQLQGKQDARRVRVLKPLIDTRYAQNEVRSAAGLWVSATDLVSPIDDLCECCYADTAIILVDEIQFFTVCQVEQLRRIVTEQHIDVVCFGLLKDFHCHLFEASKRLLELCDDARVVKAYCHLCRDAANGKGCRGTDKENRVPNKATANLRITRVGGKIQPIAEGDSILIGGEEAFIPVCYTCYSTAISPLLKKNCKTK